jgi:protein-L-isoaspartate O-methyltransferase
MAACLAQLAGPQGRVLALEKQAKLVERARASISASIPELCNTVDVRVCNVMAGERQQSLCVLGYADSSRQSAGIMARVQFNGKLIADC